MALFLNLMPQVLSAFALLTSMLKIGAVAAMVTGVGLMIIYVVFGGVWGVGYAGLVSNLLKYASMCLIAVVVATQAGGVSGFLDMFPVFPWFSLLGNGLASGIAIAMSAMIGIMSSQTYIQYVLSAKGSGPPV